MNLSDALHLRRAGPRRRSRWPAPATPSSTSLPTRQVWLSLLIAQQAFDSGDWETADAALAEVARRRARRRQLGARRRLRHAELALARDEREAARAQLARAAELAVDSREPQYLGVLGALQVELAAREGDVGGRARRGRRGARPDRVLLGRRAAHGDGLAPPG